MKTFLLSTLAGAVVTLSGIALPGTAMADTPVFAAADLNIRAGPGARYPVVGVLPAGESAMLRGCIAGSKWCSVSDSGGGWINSDFVTADFGGERLVLTERPADADIAVVRPPADVGSYDDDQTASIVRDEPGDFAEPPMEVRTYIRTHRYDSVYLDGDVADGTVLPDTVELREIPNYDDYRYVYVNDQPALIDPGTRRVVYLMR